MAQAIVSLEESWIPHLSKFLIEGFDASSNYHDFAEPDVLHWKFFKQRGRWIGSRSLVVKEDDKIIAHVGLCTSEFCSTRKGSKCITAIHITDWLTSRAGDPWGGILMLTTWRRAEVQYVLGSTSSSHRVLMAAKFRELFSVPLFHKVLFPPNPAIWSEIHGTQRFWKQTALRAVDTAQSLLGMRARCCGPLQLRAVSEFGDEVHEIIGRFSEPLTFTSRDPSLLNYYLRYPKKVISGWLLENNGRVCGFALLSLLDKGNHRVGKIVDCFLDSPEPQLWRAAVALLGSKLIELRADLISCFASTPWIMEALRQNGYFRRGRQGFYLHDAKNSLTLEKYIHLTHLEADLAYI